MAEACIVEAVRRSGTSATTWRREPAGGDRTKLMTTMHELERTGGRYGLPTMCEDGGQASVTIIERR